MISHKTWLHNMWSFSFGSIYIISFDFLNQYISLWDRCLKFFIFQFNELDFGFLGIIHFILRHFPFILVKYDRLLQLNISFHLKIYIWWALLSKNNKINVWEDI